MHDQGAAPWGVGGEVLEGADRRGHADTAGDQHQRSRRRGVDGHVTERERDLQRVAGMQILVQPGGHLTCRATLGRPDPLDRERQRTVAG
ncbi:hypothetical protein [Nocardia amamiensis]|uniref:hypothetical protein n=1 Tax=Nocardia amamiensis TaxID=404578 RepID=UPI0012F4EC94|nr:hypothetical protein [Nocardia amamiensis]